MTREEFNNHSFGASDKFTYEGSLYDIVGVHFTEALVGIDMFDDPDDLTWVRCESGDIS